MRREILTSIIVLFFSLSALAQKSTFSSAEFNKNLGKTGTLCDTVYSLHIFSDTLTLLNMGAAYPNQKYTIAVKGNKINLDWTTIKGKPLCITGVFILFKERPEIVITEPDQINAK